MQIKPRGLFYFFVKILSRRYFILQIMSVLSYLTLQYMAKLGWLSTQLLRNNITQFSWLSPRVCYMCCVCTKNAGHSGSVRTTQVSMNINLSISEPHFVLQISQPPNIAQKWFCIQNLHMDISLQKKQTVYKSVS